LDPPAWCDRNRKKVNTDIQNYPLPDPTWEWCDSEWLVDMSCDVDPNGWQYAFRFRGHTWRGHSKLFHSFVRRRRWIRLRRKKLNLLRDFEESLSSPGSFSSGSQPTSPTSMQSSFSQSSDTASLEPISLFQENSELAQQLSFSRVDREKIALVQSVVEQRMVPFSADEVEDILNCLEFDSSRDRLRKIFNGHAARFNVAPQSATNTVRSKASNPIEDLIRQSSDLLLIPETMVSSRQGTAPSLYSDAKSFLE